MAREVVTRRTVLHHYCSTRIRFEPPTQSVTCNSYNMGKRDLPDIYALARGRGHTYQANPDCTCYK